MFEAMDLEAHTFEDDLCTCRHGDLFEKGSYSRRI